MIDQLGSRAPGANITLRINPGFGHGHSQKTNTGGEQSKHGIWHDQMPDCLRRADHHGLGVTGLHMHIGSGTDLGASGAGLRGDGKAGRGSRAARSPRSAPAAGCPCSTGGRHLRRSRRLLTSCGTPAASGWKSAFGHALRLEIEPGRYLVAESGYLVAEIRAVKRQDDNMFYLLDAGFNNLARPILYGAYHPMSIVPGRRRPTSAAAEARPLKDVVVGGPLCESGDIFTQEEGGFVCTRSLPTAEVGELLVIECAGAYGFVMGSNYNSQAAGRRSADPRRPTPPDPPPADFEDLMRGELIPQW